MFNDEFRKPLMHAHEFWEISYVYESSGLHNTETESFPISRRGIVLTSPGAVHGMSSPESKNEPIMCDCVCLITDDYFKELIHEIKKVKEISASPLFTDIISGKTICLYINDDGGVYELLWRAALEYNRSALASDIMVKQLVCCVLINILRIDKQKNGYSSETALKSIEILIKYLKNNMGSKITLSQIADLLHFTPEYTCRYFKKHMGVSIYTYLTELRMKRAMDLLSNLSYSVSDIAFYCGYQYLSNFQKTFKNHTGMTPSEYKKANRTASY